MKHLALAALLAVSSGAAYAQPVPSCKAQAAEKKLAGAALKSFVGKCERDATAACDRSAADKKLTGAARTSHVKKCVGAAVGS